MCSIQTFLLAVTTTMLFRVPHFHVRFRFLKQQLNSDSTIVRQAVCVDIHVLLFACRNTMAQQKNNRSIAAHEVDLTKNAE